MDDSEHLSLSAWLSYHFARPSPEENTMVVTRKLLISSAAVVVVLFVIANPLGDAHHGLGRHNAFFADLGQGLWIASLIGAAAFVVLVLVALIQRGLRSRHASR